MAPAAPASSTVHAKDVAGNRSIRPASLATFGPTGWWAIRTSVAPSLAAISASAIVAALNRVMPASSCMRTTRAILCVLRCGRRRSVWSGPPTAAIIRSMFAWTRSGAISSPGESTSCGFESVSQFIARVFYHIARSFERRPASTAQGEWYHRGLLPAMAPDSFDVLFTGATVLDGTGAPPRVADVGVVGDRVAAVGDLGGASADQTHDLAGRVLAPGFIDVHTHDDNAVLRAPDCLAKISQGVTTVVVGNCGISAAPVRLQGRPPEPLNLLGGRDDFPFDSFAGYVDAVGAAGPAVNVAALAGHTSLRISHVGDLARAATARERLGMQKDLERCMASGAIGLSTGLAYPNALAASTGEVVGLREGRGVGRGPLHHAPAQRVRPHPRRPRRGLRHRRRGRPARRRLAPQVCRARRTGGAAPRSSPRSSRVRGPTASGWTATRTAPARATSISDRSTSGSTS